MEVLPIGVIGVRVSVITLQEQEHGTELDLAPTRHLSVMEGICILLFPLFSLIFKIYFKNLLSDTQFLWKIRFLKHHTIQ